MAEKALEAGLARSLTLPLLVLYGLGVTVGAGIYVLIGAATARAGVHAPQAFVLAAIVMGLSGATFAELAGRLPHSAGEATYVRSAFGSERLALLTGLLVILVALVSAATIATGAAGYIAIFVPFDKTLIAIAVSLLLGTIAAMGIREAISLAAVMTVIELAGLVAIIIGAAVAEPRALASQVASGLFAMPTIAMLPGLIGASMLAFFAFIGFESLVNLAEEAHAPAKLIPRAILATLLISTVLYMLVVAAATLVVPTDELAASAAPLSLVFTRATGASPLIIAVVAIFATFNGVIAQIILAARVIYGLARQGTLPAALGRVHARTSSPIVATTVATLCVVGFTLAGTLDQLADMTTRLMLIVFALVHGALIALKLRGDTADTQVFVVGLWVPVAGLISCLAMLVASFLV